MRVIVARRRQGARVGTLTNNRGSVISSTTQFGAQDQRPLKTAVSVVIPTYNAESLIRETLQSVLTQTSLPDEVIVVDDASTDRTLDVVDELADATPVCIRVIRLARNSGTPPTPLNIGIREARGEWIALLDHDDIMLPEKLARQMEAARIFPDVEFVLSDYQIFTEQGLVAESDVRHQDRQLHALLTKGEGSVHLVTPEDAVVAFGVGLGVARSCSNYFFRRSLWDRVGGFDPRIGLASDADFLLRSIESQPLAWIDAVLFHKRCHSQNLGGTSPCRSYLHSMRARQRCLRRFPSIRPLRESVELRTLDAARMLRGETRYLEAIEMCIELIRLGHPKAATLECLKTLLAIPRDAIMRVMKARVLS
jgi:glycosyltransferase involved in cell wall biosynthesis